MIDELEPSYAGAGALPPNDGSFHRSVRRKPFGCRRRRIASVVNIHFSGALLNDESSLKRAVQLLAPKLNDLRRKGVVE